LNYCNAGHVAKGTGETVLTAHPTANNVNSEPLVKIRKRSTMNVRAMVITATTAGALLIGGTAVALSASASENALQDVPTATETDPAAQDEALAGINRRQKVQLKCKMRNLSTHGVLINSSKAQFPREDLNRAFCRKKDLGVWDANKKLGKVTSMHNHRSTLVVEFRK
jgi:hypothetical protein